MEKKRDTQRTTPIPANASLHQTEFLKTFVATGLHKSSSSDSFHFRETTVIATAHWSEFPTLHKLLSQFTAALTRKLFIRLAHSAEPPHTSTNVPSNSVFSYNSEVSVFNRCNARISFGYPKYHNGLHLIPITPTLKCVPLRNPIQWNIHSLLNSALWNQISPFSCLRHKQCKSINNQIYFKTWPVSAKM